MLFDFISFVAAGFAVAGIVLGLNHLLSRATGRRLPKWVMPFAAGLTMIAYAIWNEYSWADRAAAGLPAGSTVIFRNAASDFWRPWTFVVPVTTRIAAVDTRSASLPPAPAPEMRHAYVYLMERWKPFYARVVLYDCAGHRRLDGSAASAGDLASADWVPLGADDAGLAAACGKGGSDG